MKVVLVSPPVDIEKTLGKVKGCSSFMPPLSLAYIAAVLLKKGISVKVVDAYSYNYSIEETVNHILDEKPDLIGISCLTPGVPIIHKIAALLKERNKEIKIFMGGIHPTLMPNETLSDKNIDFVIRGEGEETIIELIDAVQNKSSLNSIRGLSYRYEVKIINNVDRGFIADLDLIPFPAWAIFPLHLYGPPPHWDLKSPAFPMLASRGCPYRCTYCSLQTTGGKLRSRSAKNVVDEIEWLVNKFNAKEIMFMDAAFPLNRQRGMEIFDEIIKRGLHKKMVWLCETRVNHMDIELAQKMKESGCRRVALGIESGDQQLLNNIKKGITLEQVERTMSILKKAKIETIAYFMLGLPGETRELSLKTINFAKKIDADFVKFNIAVPYPGTELYKQAIAEGTLTSIEWDKYTSFSGMTKFDPVYTPKGMTPEQLKEIQKTAIKMYYFRPRTFLKHIVKIRSINDIKKYISAFVSVVKGVFT